MGKHKNAQPECRKRLRESGSQTDEDSLQEEVSSGHCCEVKFAEVNTKLDKILHSLTELTMMLVLSGGGEPCRYIYKL